MGNTLAKLAGRRTVWITEYQKTTQRQTRQHCNPQGVQDVGKDMFGHVGFGFAVFVFLAIDMTCCISFAAAHLKAFGQICEKLRQLNS